MVSVSELVVAIRGEGVDETEQDLESMNETVQESSEELSEQAGMMEQLGGEFAGALGVAVTGLAVASAGLLSQVPVLGQLFQGLFAVVQSLALTMDTVLRPVLGPISKKLFDLSAAIAGTEGKGRKLVGVVTTIGTVLLGALAAAVKFFGAAATFGKIAAAFKVAGSIIVGVITTLAGILSLPVSVTAALVAGVIALLAVLLTDFRGWRTELIKIIKNVASAFINGFQAFLSDPIGMTKSFISDMIDLLFNTDWLALGGKLANQLIQGIKSTLGLDGGGGGGGALDFDASNLLPDVDTSLGGGGGSTPALSNIRQNQQNPNNQQLPSQRTETPKIILDGREVGRGTGGERFDESARRGQTF